MRTAINLLPDVMPSLPGVPIPAVERALLRTAQDMCRRSRCWTAWTDPVTTSSGGHEYDADAPPGAAVEMVTGCTINGRPAPILPWEWMETADDDHGGSDVVVTGRLHFFAPNVPDGSDVRFQMVLVPSERAYGIDDDLFDQYTDVLANGVIAKLAMTPNQSYSNPDLAMAHAAAFSAQVARMKLKQWRGYTNKQPRSRVTWC